MLRARKVTATPSCPSRGPGLSAPLTGSSPQPARVGVMAPTAQARRPSPRGENSHVVTHGQAPSSAGLTTEVCFFLTMRESSVCVRVCAVHAHVCLCTCVSVYVCAHALCVCACVCVFAREREKW